MHPTADSVPQLVECVPNVSEGRKPSTIEAIAEAIRSVPGAYLLHVDSGPAANRTVYTFVGSVSGVGEAAFRVAERCAALIDMRDHKGAHPRLGALDVCPFVPLRNVTMGDCVAMAHALGARIGRELDVPVYFYEHAARRDDRRGLAQVRAGEYEGLAARLADPLWAPDCGPAAWRPAFGAAIVGARPFLIAFNVTLATRDPAVARAIAARVRERGQVTPGVDRLVQGEQNPAANRLTAVRAIGWFIEEYGRAQVSMNLVDFHATPPHVAFEAVRVQAAAMGVAVEGSEIIGLTPLEPLVAAGQFYLAREGCAAPSEAEAVATAIRGLGLSHHRPFLPEERVIEYVLSARLAHRR